MQRIFVKYSEYNERTEELSGDSEYPLSKMIEISINNNLGEISFNFPSQEADFQLIEHFWYCPTIFSLFHIEDFFNILTAVLLERSLIFVSDSLTILSAAILGFRTLIKPFSWCYALVPVLP
jgi:DENN (AEX-3) domain